MEPWDLRLREKDRQEIDRLRAALAAAETRAERAEALLHQWQQDHAAAARDDERWRGSYDVLMATEKYFTALRGEEAQP